MRKFILCIMLTVMAFSMVQSANIAFAAASGTFDIRTDSVAVTEGQSFTVNIVGKDIQDLYAYEARLTYDNSLLESPNVTHHVQGTPVKKADGNKIIIALAKSSASVEKGNITLCTLTFKARTKGKAYLTLDTVKLMDYNLASTDYTPNRKIEVTITGGDNDVPPAGSVSPPESPPAFSPSPIPGLMDVPSGDSSPMSVPSGLQDREIKFISAETGAVLNPETGIAAAGIEAETVAGMVVRAIEAEASGKKPVIEITAVSAEEVKAVELKIPAEAIKKVSDETKAELKVVTGIGSISFNTAALSSIGASANDEDICVSMRRLETDELEEGIREKVGDRPVYDFSVKAGQTRISDFGGGKVEISVPYTPREGEDENAIIVYYLTDAGELQTVRGRYDSATQTVRFTTSHLSIYVVGYNKVTFTDAGDADWFGKAVGFMAARGITKGVGGGRFAPQLNVTRADFLVMVMRAYDIKPDKEINDNFSDAGNKYYTEYLGTAKRLGLVLGVGNNKYAPELTISRQDMFVILYRILERIGELPQGTDRKTLESFADKENISDYAMEAMNWFVVTGTVKGDGTRLNPKSAATRAETAQILYNLLSR